MSNTTSCATATCQVAELPDTETAALAVYDYLVNHPDEIPEALNEGDSDETVAQIKSYLSLQGKHLTISYSTAHSSNYDSAVFDFLSKHFACLQTSLFMEVTWVVEDSKSGPSAGTDFYDRSGALIDVRDVLMAHLL